MCPDERGPEAAKHFPSRQLVRALPAPAGSGPVERARREIDFARRGTGSGFGAFIPAMGAARTAPYEHRTIATWVDFLEPVAAWLPTEAERVDAILDKGSVHRATDALLFASAHPLSVTPWTLLSKCPTSAEGHATLQ